MANLFITGTDTGVGKTVVAGAIAAHQKAAGAEVGVMKPAETGCCTRDGKLVPSDASFLKRASGTTDILGAVCPYTFEEPLAPAIAAKNAGREISAKFLIKVYRAISRQHDMTIVEGAGGIMVPICADYSYLDLASDLDIPVVIVARAGLGTINHTLLTVHALRSKDIDIHSIILNHDRKSAADASTDTNPEVIRELSGIDSVFTLPYMPGIKRGMKTLKKAAGELEAQGFFGLT
jgi:dethiobiotin synthetase